MDMVVTVGKRRRNRWLIENKEAIANDMELLFKLGRMPRYAKPGDRCYIVIDNHVIGWHIIHHFEVAKEDWTCEITGETWSAGIYVVRKASTWTECKKPVSYKSRRGFKYIPEHEWRKMVDECA